MDSLIDHIAQAIIDSGHAPWPAKAACAEDPRTMDATEPPEVWTALRICQDCPVVPQCASWADEEPEYVGVAAGQIYHSRKTRRRERRAS